MKKIDVLSTGGTFDKIYGAGAGVSNFTFPEISSVKDICARLGIRNIKVSYDLKKAKDSLDMNDADRNLISLWCRYAISDRCVIIHGTDTMIKTASVIAKKLQSNKVVVLTGALQPSRMRDTDAEFNLGGALIAAQTCPPGVYIVMSGTIYPYDKCRKNPKTGHFEPL